MFEKSREKVSLKMQISYILKKNIWISYIWNWGEYVWMCVYYIILIFSSFLYYSKRKLIVFVILCFDTVTFTRGIITQYLASCFFYII